MKKGKINYNDDSIFEDFYNLFDEEEKELVYEDNKTLMNLFYLFFGK